ncbi:MAG TPA: hypothetical protein VJB57_18020 [Dehalococcoidia bacterium]|nr:hypothetical protein [Dehalococcoidia bacterium]
MPTYEVESIRFADTTADQTPGGLSWYARGQNFLVGYSVLEPGAVLRSPDLELEHMIGVVEGTLQIESKSGSGQSHADAIVIAPPNGCVIRAVDRAILFRVFAPAPPEFAGVCANWASYDVPRDNVAPFEPWPAPPDGDKLRVYQYDQMPVGSRKVFRSRNIMVNWEGHPGGPVRDLKRFTPHSHDDFEQGSLELWGSYVHHLRYPWEADFTAWRPDQRLSVSPAGLTIMPVNVIHTSQGLDERNCLADIFAPPRLDFSRAGYVYNDLEYPMPEAAKKTVKS